jgi:hypothetical protein
VLKPYTQRMLTQRLPFDYAQGRRAGLNCGAPLALEDFGEHGGSAWGKLCGGGELNKEERAKGKGDARLTRLWNEQ